MQAAVFKGQTKLFHRINTENNNRIQIYTLKQYYSTALNWITQFCTKNSITIESNDTHKSGNTSDNSYKSTPTFNTTSNNDQRITTIYADVVKTRMRQIFIKIMLTRYLFLRFVMIISQTCFHFL